MISSRIANVKSCYPIFTVYAIFLFLTNITKYNIIIMFVFRT